ncbi:MAG: EAL domain-containing protein [Propionibacteriales bacterium]|nr:EAL domain-containing protein [Propionibacteriales bacterium]
MTRARASHLFNSTVVVTGAGLAFVALVTSALHWEDLRGVYFLAVPAIVLMGYFPMLIGRTGGGIEIGLDSCVLVFLANSLGVHSAIGPWQSLVIWSLGTALCQAMTDKRRPVKAFNIGLGVIAGGLALLVIHKAQDLDGPLTPRDLLATGAGAAVYFVADFLMSATSLSLEEGTSLPAELAPTGALTAFVAFLAIASLGFLVALVTFRLDPRSALLFTVPVMTILVASRAQSRGGEHARRLKVLLDTAVRAQTVGDRATMLEILRDGASDLLRDPRVSLRTDPPGPHEIGVLVRGADDELWIVSPALNRARSTAKDDQTGLEALVAVTEDTLARLRLSDAMAHQVWHDSLTGLANRSLFMDRVGHAMELQRRRGGRLAVLFCDLDAFKRVNDLFGHAAGDELLIEVGRRIRATVRETDTVARLGGDEFAVLLEEVHEPGEVEVSCQRILSALRVRFPLFGEDVLVTTTIGVAMSETGASADALLSQADLAMYHAKSLGKDRFETYRLSFGDERIQRIELVETLRRAVDAKTLEVFYQPVVDLQTHVIKGVEALVRWRRDGVLVPPELFIPTAEESGLIVGLGDIVLDIVTRDAPKLVAAAGRTLSVAVNVSAQQLQLEGFATRVQAARARMGDVQLVLEVTERDFVNNEPRALTAMNTLVAAGVWFAIDDFGVGFSSIGYLQRLPVRILKVDKTFLTNIEEDSRACTLVRSMVLMGEALDLEVIIEGIERRSQLAHVTSHAGAGAGQGYLFGRPVPLDDMTTILSASAQSWPDIPHVHEALDEPAHVDGVRARASRT